MYKITEWNIFYKKRKIISWQLLEKYKYSDTYNFLFYLVLTIWKAFELKSLVKSSEIVGGTISWACL